MSEEALKIAQDAADRMFENDRASKSLGMEVEIPAPGRAISTMTVTENMLNGFDMCHGGIIFSLADTAFAFSCNSYGRTTVAAGASMEWLRPVRVGDRLTADAREIQRGRRTGYYDIRVTNQDDELVALFRGRAAEPRSPAGK